MLNSPEKEVLAKACEAIYKFALKGLDFFGLLLNFISFLKYLPHGIFLASLPVKWIFSDNQSVI